MLSLAELMERIDTLSKEEIVEVRKAVEQRWIDLQRAELTETTRRTREEYDSNRTSRTTTPEENKKWPNNIRLC